MYDARMTRSHILIKKILFIIYLHNELLKYFLRPGSDDTFSKMLSELS